MDVTVAVATYGDALWSDLAYTRAIPSVPREVPVVHAHRDSLHDARNAALDVVDTEFVCHLDADDELELGFFDHMAAGTADLRAPAVRYHRRGGFRPEAAAVPNVVGHRHDCEAACLPEGNWLVIGTVARTAVLRDVGGWHDFPMYEDWDLWVRCWHAGATIEAIPEAVYRAHVRDDSRNRAPARADRLATHQAIAAANGLPVPA